MYAIRRSPRHRLLVTLLLLIGGWCLRGTLNAAPVERPTLLGTQSDRNRIMLGFRGKPEVIQAWLPSPWRLDPVQKGPLQGANIIVALVDRIRDDDPKGGPNIPGADRIVNFAVPARHPQTGQTVSVIVSGRASNAARIPGVFQVYRPASIRVEQTFKSQDGDMEEVTDIWEVRDTAGAGKMALQLQSRRLRSAQIRVRGETRAISAKDSTVEQLHRFEAIADIVKSLPEGIERVQRYAFHVDIPELAPLFDGSEQLIGISVTSWYVRQVFMP